VVSDGLWCLQGRLTSGGTKVAYAWSNQSAGARAETITTGATTTLLSGLVASLGSMLCVPLGSARVGGHLCGIGPHDLGARILSLLLDGSSSAALCSHKAFEGGNGCHRTS
jgi:hypothetical protein